MGLTSRLPYSEAVPPASFSRYEGIEVRQPPTDTAPVPPYRRGPASWKKMAAVAAAILMTVSMLGLYYYQPWVPKKDTTEKHYATGLIPDTFVRIQTSMGDIEVMMARHGARATVSNFLNLSASGFYTGTVFHRVIKNFMIQGGGFLPDLTMKDTSLKPIKLENDSGLKNVRGTIAMARASAPDSATSQFFINLVDNTRLDPSVSSPGYAVFGTVVSGMGVVDAIANVTTSVQNGMDDVPVAPVIINHIITIERG